MWRGLGKTLTCKSLCCIEIFKKATMCSLRCLRARAVEVTNLEEDWEEEDTEEEGEEEWEEEEW